MSKGHEQLVRTLIKLLPKRIKGLCNSSKTKPREVHEEERTQDFRLFPAWIPRFCFGDAPRVVASDLFSQHSL